MNFPSVTATLLILAVSLAICAGRRQLQCRQTVWGPGPLTTLTSLYLPRLKTFSSPERCAAAMCVPRCAAAASRPLFPQATRDRRSTSYPNPQAESPVLKPYPGSDLLTVRPPQAPGADFKQVEEMKAILGPGTELLLDADGQVIGLQAPPEPIKQEDSNRPGPQSEQKNLPRDDGSSCCTTREMFFMNSSMVDYFGITRTVAQNSHVGSYQFIRHGLCGRKGACMGDCHLIYVTVSLAIYPPRPGEQTSFGFFKVPGYCTCRVLSQAWAGNGNLVSGGAMMADNDLN